MIRTALKNYFVHNFGFEAPETIAFFRYCEVTKPNDLRDMAIAKRLANDPE